MRFRGMLPFGAVLLSAASLQAQVAFHGNYSQDFNELGSSGTTLPVGWSAIRIAGSGEIGAGLTLGVTTGTATSGGVFNTGSAGDTDRALGVLASSATVPAFGLQLVNLTGALIDQVTLSGVMEQWRTGSSATVDERVTCEFSMNAAGLDDAMALWQALPDFDLVERLTGTTSAGAIDGNLEDHQRPMQASISNLQWADHGVLTFRWVDMDHAGSDGLYALDNLQIAQVVSPIPEPSSVLTLLLGMGMCGGVRRWRRLRMAAV
jgi:trimeric autotransporter adhesin